MHGCVSTVCRLGQATWAEVQGMRLGQGKETVRQPQTEMKKGGGEGHTDVLGDATWNMGQHSSVRRGKQGAYEAFVTISKMCGRFCLL